MPTVMVGHLNMEVSLHGPEAGRPLLLIHGWPDDASTWNQVAPALATAGFRVIVPTLRGFGATRFLNDDTPRTGNSAMLAIDMIALLDALGIDRFMVAGHDWGSNTAEALAVGWPDRVERMAMLSYVIDLYAGDLARHPDAVDLEAPLLDAKGYYALGRRGADGTLHERQLDFHGGLRWRYEELLPADRRRIDRIALFRTAPGLRVGADHRFNVEEYNTYSCPWHHNLTAVVASFRVAKALVGNPGSRDEVRDLRWRNSVRFDWSSQQLMELGLMEPGQWF